MIDREGNNQAWRPEDPRKINAKPTSTNLLKNTIHYLNPHFFTNLHPAKRKHYFQKC